jgi:hypothetical protein
MPAFFIWIYGPSHQLQYGSYAGTLQLHQQSELGRRARGGRLARSRGLHLHFCWSSRFRRF